MSTRTRTASRRARALRYRHQRLPEGFPPCPPALRLKTPDPWARRLLQQRQISENQLPQASAVTSQYEDDHDFPCPAYHATPVYISPKPFFRRREQPLAVSQLWQMIRRIRISTGET
ncbi:hypothetical protein PENNAL_c0109G01971 [Penicillium nalgiovense]|uniref:Uncharacterized protein n=1 Tax=Penicillium nalgiovense TaxID=60175 RepID=A0A1V6X7N9_PENNA|nr:hypothetical protein PENNAL_c0109G01971 [Penicillium nalgiovense]